MIDNRTGRQAAVLRCRDLGEEEYAHQVYCLGKWYNWALVGVENNYSSYPTRELERLGYPRLYVREVEDSFTHRLRKSYGFLTTAVTRPVLIAGLQTLMRQTPEAVVDRETLSEMLTFIYNERRRPEAQAGAHDDLVLALGIAHFIRGQQSFERLLPEPEPAPGEGLDYDSLLCGGELGRGYLTD